MAAGAASRELREHVAAMDPLLAAALDSPTGKSLMHLQGLAVDRICSALGAVPTRTKHTVSARKALPTSRLPRHPSPIVSPAHGPFILAAALGMYLVFMLFIWYTSWLVQRRMRRAASC